MGQQIGELLGKRGAATSRTSSGETTPLPADASCPRCHVELPLAGYTSHLNPARELPREEQGQPIPHACCACQDTGRVWVGDRELRGKVRGKIEPCACRAASKPSVEEQMARAGVPAHHMEATMAKVPDGPRLAIQLWASIWPPEEAVTTFLGGYGSGKTSAAAAVVRAAINRYGARCHFVTGPDLLERLRATQAKDLPEDHETEQMVMDFLRAIDLLVLDDLGKEKDTEWAQDMLWKLINHRWANKKPTIVTGNNEDLIAMAKGSSAGGAIASRLMGSPVLNFGNVDRRKEGRRPIQ